MPKHARWDGAVFACTQNITADEGRNGMAEPFLRVKVLQAPQEEIEETPTSWASSARHIVASTAQERKVETEEKNYFVGVLLCDPG